jgi:ATP-dependent DNA helicase UvrD/PcrA
MGADWTASPQQWAAISAPLEPAVVIAGAGSGKTTLMAARVVHLVLTGQVRPDQVLGLTFTTKAASELRSKVRSALVAAGALDDAGPDAEDVVEPTVATYNAYAAGLLTDHGLRIGHEPDTRVITDAARYQLGARVVDRYPGEIVQLTDHAETAIQNLLALDSAMSEHLVTPERVREFDAAEKADFLRAYAEEEAGKARKTYLGPIADAVSAIDGSRRTSVSWTSPTRSSSVRGWRRCSPTSASPSATGSGSCCWTSTKTPRWPRRSCSPGSSPTVTR